MNPRRLFQSMVLVAVTLATLAGSAHAKEALVINLTQNETSRAAMAVFLAEAMMTEKDLHTAIFLNVDGVRLADKNLPGNKYVDGQTVQEKLQSFMKAGGKVYVCPMCMKNVGGMDEADLIAGAEVATVEALYDALYEYDTRVLSY